MATVVIVFFISGFIHGYVILWLNGHLSKKVPNLWCWHAAWGIASVVLVNYCFIWNRIPFSPEIALQSLSVTFVAAFPGIYLANHIQWLKQDNKKKPRILNFEMLFKNGRSKKTG